MSDDLLRTALLAVSVYSSDGPRLLKQVAEDIQENLDLAALSSIYKVRNERHRPQHIHDLRNLTTFEGLSVAALVHARKSPLKILHFLKEVEVSRKSEQLHRSVSINILMVEDETLMTPELTLPYPDFHRRPELLIPAAEIWGEVHHPILKTSLNSLTQNFASEHWGEFFAQGKSLLG